MEINFEKTGDARGVITVNVTEADYADKVTEKLKEIGKKHTIPGFRKGHITLPQLRQRFGREVKSEAINDVVFHAVFKYIEDNKIDILGQPLPEASQEIDLKQTDYTFKYEVALAPELDIKLDKEVTLPFYTIAVSDEMAADQDKMLRERFGAQVLGEEVDDKAVVKGSIMELNGDGTVKETADAIQVVSGIVAPFLFKDKDEAAKFLGKKVGDKVVFNPARAAGDSVPEIASMLNVDKEQAAQVRSDFEFVISEITVLRLAEHDQEFYDNVFGKDKVHDEEEYDKALRQFISAQLAPNSFQLFNRDASEYLMKTYGDFTLDAELLKRWLARTNPEMTAEQIDKDFDGMIPGIKWEIVSGKVADLLHVEVTDEILNARATAIARQQLQQYGMYNMDDETVADMGRRLLADRKIAQQIHNQCEEIAMYDAIRAAVTVDQKEVSFDDFKKLAEAPAAQA